MTIVVAAETLLLVVIAFFVIALLRSHAEILRRLELLSSDTQLPDPDARAPSDLAAVDLQGGTLDGGARRIVLSPGPDTLLAFLSTGCSTCVGLLEALRADAPSLPPGLRLVVVTKDRRLEGLRLLQRLGHHLEIVMSSEAWDTYRVPGSPYFLHVEGSSGRILGEGSAAGWPQVLSLILDAAEDRSPDSVGRNRIDDALAAAGIGPGHPSLRPTAADSGRGE